jgi:hypothetical protein
VIDALIRTYLLASVGVGLEVAFTALSGLRQREDEGDRRLTGHSFLWMFPIYGLAYPFLAWSWPVLGDLPLVVRGLCYVPVLFAVEYGAGWLLRRMVGECPWEAGYRTARWGVHGLVRLDYAPAWFLVGLLFERLYLWLVAT